MDVTRKWQLLGPDNNYPICAICTHNINVANGDAFMQCALCECFVHQSKCSDLTTAQYDWMNRIDSPLRWYCPNCNSHVDQDLKTVNKKALEDTIGSVTKKRRLDESVETEAMDEVVMLTTNEKACQFPEVMDIMKFPDEMLETILSHIPASDPNVHPSPAHWKWKTLLPLRSVNRRFARLIPRIALHSFYFQAVSIEQVISFFKILGDNLLGSDGGPNISYIKDLVIFFPHTFFDALFGDEIFGNAENNFDWPSQLPLSQFQGLFNQASRLERLNVDMPLKAVLPCDLSFFNCPNLVSFHVNTSRLDTYPRQFFTPLFFPDTFPKLKDLDISTDGNLHDQEVYLEGVQGGVQRLNLDRFAIYDSALAHARFASLLAPHLESLRVLELGGEFEQGHAVGCSAIAQYCINLEHLDLSKLDDPSVVMLCAEQPGRPAGGEETCFQTSIRTIVTCDCFISTASIPHLRRLRNLKKLDIDVSNGFSEHELGRFERKLHGIVSVKYYQTIDDDSE